jgi:serine/threonine protein kinase
MNLHPRFIFINHSSCIKITNFSHCLNTAETSTYDISHVKLKELLAPELLHGEPATVKSDIYSLGRLFCFIKYGKLGHYEHVLNEHVNNKEPLAEAIHSMVDADPKNRLEMD